jgi:phenylacetate-coenzyme A ligase PaaK-like adenylate-forming protein
VETGRWGLHLPEFLQQLGIFRTLHISPFDNPRQQLEQIRAFNPQTMLGSPSSLLILAKELQNQPMDDINIERFFFVGEFVDAS